MDIDVLRRRYGDVLRLPAVDRPYLRDVQFTLAARNALALRAAYHLDARRARAWNWARCDGRNLAFYWAFPQMAAPERLTRDAQDDTFLDPEIRTFCRIFRSRPSGLECFQAVFSTFFARISTGGGGRDPG